jgi:acyl-CoA reductase-like NAD-dependent aldehyde dehydrogenase
LSDKKARKLVDQTIDRIVWYAGWTDKLASLVGGNNPVAAPFFNFSVPEPTGVIAVMAPQGDSLLGLLSVVLPAIATGNSVVVVSSFHRPIPAVTLSEVLATSDVPAGVVNILTGDFSEVGTWLAEHMDVDGIDLAGVPAGEFATKLESLAASNLKRVVRPSEVDWSDDQFTYRMRQWLEIKTVWHPIGA